MITNDNFIIVPVALAEGAISTHLENNPKQKRSLICSKPCFYNAMETDNSQEVLT